MSRGIVLSKRAYACTYSTCFQETNRSWGKTFHNSLNWKQTNKPKTNKQKHRKNPQSTQKCNWFLLLKHCDTMNEFKQSEVHGNTELANTLLIKNLFCVYAVSNLSSKVCFHPIKCASKPCSEDHDLDTSSFSCCALTTKLQKYFLFVWIWVFTLTVSII